MNGAAIAIDGLSKTFGRKQVLTNIDLTIRAGEMVGLVGASGSGKSTLIRLIGGLETMDNKGRSIELFGQTVQLAGKRTGLQRALRRDIGIVFQQFNLVDRLSLLANVLVGRLAHNPGWKGLVKMFPREEKIRALEALDRVNMLAYAHQRASTLSGGQQQRGAIARALTQEAKLILADEPIASLDPASSEMVMNLLGDINRQDGTTVVVSLHQFDVARSRCPRIVALKDGEIVYDGHPGRLRERELAEIYRAETPCCGSPAGLPEPLLEAV
jgi:phosphonate transport system ATP-binding protein